MKTMKKIKVRKVAKARYSVIDAIQDASACKGPTKSVISYNYLFGNCQLRGIGNMTDLILKAKKHDVEFLELLYALSINKKYRLLQFDIPSYIFNKLISEDSNVMDLLVGEIHYTGTYISNYDEMCNMEDGISYIVGEEVDKWEVFDEVEDGEQMEDYGYYDWDEEETPVGVLRLTQVILDLELLPSRLFSPIAPYCYMVAECSSCGDEVEVITDKMSVPKIESFTCANNCTDGSVITSRYDYRGDKLL